MTRTSMIPAWSALLALACVACGTDDVDPTTDAGADSGALDVADAGPECTPASCDDGVYCNGEERCTATGCVAGEAIACDEGLACDEARERCACEVDADGDGACAPDDCDDDAPAAWPGQLEVCNGVDDDCHATVDEGVSRTFYPDADGDGFGDGSGASVEACARPAGYAEVATDCDDARSSVHPASVELCNSIDDDCDGLVDPDCACTSGESRPCALPGACAAGIEPCVGGTWGACSIAPVVEACDGADEDCDGATDEGLLEARHPDADGDGFGAEGSVPTWSCAPASGSLNDDDCDDTRSSVSPDVSEVCNERDDDCDGVVDEGFDTASDESNCGACGSTCAPPSAIGECAAGECTVGMCLAGRIDLDGVAANGCEYRCVVSGVDDSECDLRDNDCDGRVDEDVNLANDPDHCGVCGRACESYFPRAGGSCSSGQCIMGACDPGFSDADMNPANGCEQPDVCTETETCDGVDEDCDGEIDEAPLGIGAPCGTDEGECVAGTTHCVRGRLSCVGDIPPTLEWCDGEDDDCDGVVDDDCR